MTNYVAVTDTLGTCGSVTVEPYNVADALKGWYKGDEDGPREARQVLAELQAKLNRNEDTSGEETYLGIRLENADMDDLRVETRAFNSNTGVFETIAIEALADTGDIDTAELSAEDLGCSVGDVFEVVLIHELDGADRVVKTREVTAR